MRGARSRVGYGKLIGGKQHREEFLSQIYVGWGIKAALLRTWAEQANLNPPNQSFLGLEGSATVINVNFSLGVFRHVGSSDADDDWRVTGGIGWGF